MRTPQGGQRDITWVIQYRHPPVGAEVTTWTRSGVADTAYKTKETLRRVREDSPRLEWRAIRVETVQRIEGW